MVLLILARLRAPRAAAPPPSADAPFGAELASRVANRLERGDALCYRHREYCGPGLRYCAPRYLYGEAFDGAVRTPEDLATSGADPKNIEHRVFDARADFVAWLATQSDDMLAGSELPDPWLRGNQRITRARLESFARGERIPDA